MKGSGASLPGLGDSTWRRSACPGRRFNDDKEKHVVANNGVFFTELSNGDCAAWGRPGKGGRIPEEPQKALRDHKVRHVWASDYAFFAELHNGDCVAWGRSDFGGRIPEETQKALRGHKVMSHRRMEAVATMKQEDQGNRFLNRQELDSFIQRFYEVESADDVLSKEFLTDVYQAEKEPRGVIPEERYPRLWDEHLAEMDEKASKKAAELNQAAAAEQRADWLFSIWGGIAGGAVPLLMLLEPPNPKHANTTTPCGAPGYDGSGRK